jgi:hypothetical protein
MTYRRYGLTVQVNGIWFHEVWIDPHFEEKHGGSINDELILRLVRLLDGVRLEPEKRDERSGFAFFATPVELDGKAYKLIWVIPPEQSYLGVRNAFRRSK